MTGLDIIIFAAVAAFLIYRLRSVLGRRTGHEGPAEPAIRGTDDDNVVRLPDRGKLSARPGTAGDLVAGPDVETGLAQVRLADPDFDPEGFVSGARTAFEMIVTAFAAGDQDTLRPMLNDRVYANFVNAIEARQKNGETLESTFVGVRESTIVAAELQGKTAIVTVRFTTEQINCTRDAQGAVIEGSPTAVETRIDVWTFARNTRSRDPNWKLIATEEPE